MGDQGLIDKSMRSVFVGNIPYEATEEKLKDIFNEAGPVLSFKLVYDRETGKPKGYGFCEYQDTQTALSAMRNLNGFEIGGRTLRVDNACTERSRLEMQNLQQMTPTESPYGEPISSDKAPEAICRAVASLPPEQMYELMRQMKECVQNNPAEARTMLLQNPQLSYALLQGLVVMRAVDPNVAVSLLHKSNPMPTPLFASDKPMTVPLQTPVTTAPSQVTPTVAIAQPPASTVRPSGGHTEFQAGLREEGWVTAVPPAAVPLPVPPVVPAVGPVAPVGPKIVPDPALNPVPPGPRAPPFMGGQDMDMRATVDPRLSRMGDQDLRIPPVPMAVPVPVPGPPRPGRDIPLPPPRDPREPFPQPEHFTARDPRAAAQERFPSRDPRDRVDPRTGTAPLPGPRPQTAGVPPVGPLGSLTPGQAPGLGGNLAAGAATDHEKTALIMQVLQLSEEQIAMLPPEQRQSILVLKEQIAKSVQR